jgi:phytoene synthase
VSAVAECRAVLAAKSRSFRLAARLLPEGCRDDAAVIYAWCRRADDAVDEVPPEAQVGAVAQLRAELDAVYGGQPLADPLLVAFADVVRRRRIPRLYADELVEGMAMDQRGETYRTLDDLHRYCFRVAGTVGLMMCHVMGTRRDQARVQAAHLGIAMQLTNVCRDVAEDYARGRLYLPATLVAGAVPAPRPGDRLPASAGQGLAGVIGTLLADADRFYRSGRKGLDALGWRSALACDAAARIYAAIGDELRRRGHDVLAGRAIVSTARKLWIVAGCTWRALRGLPARWRRLAAPRVPESPLGWTDDFLRP